MNRQCKARMDRRRARSAAGAHRDGWVPGQRGNKRRLCRGSKSCHSRSQQRTSFHVAGPIPIVIRVGVGISPRARLGWAGGGRTVHTHRDTLFPWSRLAGAKRLEGSGRGLPRSGKSSFPFLLLLMTTTIHDHEHTITATSSILLFLRMGPGNIKS